MRSALFPLSCSRCLPLSLPSTSPCRLITPFPHAGIVPNLWIEVSQKDPGFVGLNPSQGIVIFFHESQVQCTWSWVLYLYQTQGTVQQLKTSTCTVTPFLLVDSIHQRSLPAYKYTHFSLEGKLCWLNAVEKFPLIVHLNNVRTTTLSRRVSNNIQWISLGFLD